MLAMLAQQWFEVRTWGPAAWLIAVLVIAGAVAITLIVLRQMEMAPPPWVIKIFWIIVLVAIGAAAIRFLFTL